MGNPVLSTKLVMYCGCIIAVLELKQLIFSEFNNLDFP